jgi:phage FluMu protein Com
MTTTCTICMDPKMRFVDCTTCNHSICSDCHSSLLQPKCPYCRTWYSVPPSTPTFFTQDQLRQIIAYLTYMSDVSDDWEVREEREEEEPPSITHFTYL